jgi:PBP1b-binding outer membrane lipoprotein LpoB
MDARLKHSGMTFFVIFIRRNFYNTGNLFLARMRRSFIILAAVFLLGCNEQKTVPQQNGPITTTQSPPDSLPATAIDSFPAEPPGFRSIHEMDWAAHQIDTSTTDSLLNKPK